MLFKVTLGILQTTNQPKEAWNPSELELENYLIAQANADETDADVRKMHPSIFKEDLLLVSNQVRTSAKKRADILALDKAGNGVIIELKRNEGKLGVETQALQYLSDFSKYRGKNFLRKFGVSEDTALGFLEGSDDVDSINSRSRVILVARDFDETLYSIGEWLSSKGVAFRCISYHPYEVGDTKLLSFSVEFDRSPDGLYPLKFGAAAREPGIFWHNIARAEQRWWKFLVSASQIPACFDDAPGDQGEKILTKYMPGDRIVAYAKGYGAIGWGIIDDPKYRLISSGHEDDVLPGCRHRITIRWRATAHLLSDGLGAEAIRKAFGIHHPISTSVTMNMKSGENLLAELSRRFCALPSAQVDEPQDHP